MKKFYVLFLVIVLTGCVNNAQYQPLRVMEIVSVQYHYERELDIQPPSGFQTVQAKIKITNNSTSAFPFSSSFIRGMTNTNRFFRLSSMRHVDGESIELDTIASNSSQSYILVLNIPDTETLALINYDDFRGNLFESVVDNTIETIVPLEQEEQEEQEDSVQP